MGRKGEGGQIKSSEQTKKKALSCVKFSKISDLKNRVLETPYLSTHPFGTIIFTCVEGDRLVVQIKRVDHYNVVAPSVLAQVFAAVNPDYASVVSFHARRLRVNVELSCNKLNFGRIK